VLPAHAGLGGACGDPEVADEVIAAGRLVGAVHVREQVECVGKADELLVVVQQDLGRRLAHRVDARGRHLRRDGVALRRAAEGPKGVAVPRPAGRGGEVEVGAGHRRHERIRSCVQRFGVTGQRLLGRDGPRVLRNPGQHNCERGLREGPRRRVFVAPLGGGGVVVHDAGGGSNVVDLFDHEEVLPRLEGQRERRLRHPQEALGEVEHELLLGARGRVAVGEGCDHFEQHLLVGLEGVEEGAAVGVEGGGDASEHGDALLPPPVRDAPRPVRENVALELGRVLHLQVVVRRAVHGDTVELLVREGLLLLLLLLRLGGCRGRGAESGRSGPEPGRGGRHGGGPRVGRHR
jgi:hypothetical protein